jgi:outer membrane protein assembly factor BamB
VASGSDNKVYALKPDGSLIGAFDGGGMSGPWSTTIDGEDNVWVANFGPFSGNFSNGRITKLSGASNPRYKPGTPLSPKTGYNLKSQGKEVLLANGESLYGTGKGKCFCPLMRLTTVAIDQAGNLWALNNWKPSFAVDLAKNPGGDGLVIFVGLVPPRNRQ